LGFEGEFSQVIPFQFLHFVYIVLESRVGAVKTSYEIKPMAIDHKPLETVNSSIN
jgi:hypothetical protein